MCEFWTCIFDATSEALAHSGTRTERHNVAHATPEFTVVWISTRALLVREPSRNPFERRSAPTSRRHVAWEALPEPDFVAHGGRDERFRSTSTRARKATGSFCRVCCRNVH